MRHGIVRKCLLPFFMHVFLMYVVYVHEAWNCVWVFVTLLRACVPDVCSVCAWGMELCASVCCHFVGVLCIVREGATCVRHSVSSFLSSRTLLDSWDQRYNICVLQSYVEIAAGHRELSDEMTNQIVLCSDTKPIGFAQQPSKLWFAGTKCPTKSQPLFLAQILDQAWGIVHVCAWFFLISEAAT